MPIVYILIIKLGKLMFDEGVHKSQSITTNVIKWIYEHHGKRDAITYTEREWNSTKLTAFSLLKVILN